MYDGAAKRVDLQLQQVQAGAPYRLPLEIALTMSDGEVTVRRVELLTPEGHFTIASEREPTNVIIDPNTWTLLEGANVTRRSQP
jgi:hypothetical protein